MLAVDKGLKATDGGAVVERKDVTGLHHRVAGVFVDLHQRDLRNHIADLGHHRHALERKAGRRPHRLQRRPLVRLWQRPLARRQQTDRIARRNVPRRLWRWHGVEQGRGRCGQGVESASAAAAAAVVSHLNHPLQHLLGRRVDHKLVVFKVGRSVRGPSPAAHAVKATRGNHQGRVGRVGLAHRPERHAKDAHQARVARRNTGGGVGSGCLQAVCKVNAGPKLRRGSRQLRVKLGREGSGRGKAAQQTRTNVPTHKHARTNPHKHARTNAHHQSREKENNDTDLARVPTLSSVSGDDHGGQLEAGGQDTKPVLRTRAVEEQTLVGHRWVKAAPPLGPFHLPQRDHVGTDEIDWATKDFIHGRLKACRPCLNALHRNAVAEQSLTQAATGTETRHAATRLRHSHAVKDRLAELRLGVDLVKRPGRDRRHVIHGQA